MRVCLSDFDGRPVLHLRQYIKTRAGEWLPTKAGVTVRLGEIRAVIEALGRAEAAMMDDAANQSAPTPPRWDGPAEAHHRKSEVASRPERRHDARVSRETRHRVGSTVADSGLREVPPWEDEA